MRKRTVKFLIESVLIIVICLTPLFLYGLQLVSSKDLAYGETDGESVTSLTFTDVDTINNQYELDLMTFYGVPRNLNFSISYGEGDLRLHIDIDTFFESYARITIFMEDRSTDDILLDSVFKSNFFIEDYFVFSFFDYLGSFFPESQIFMFSYFVYHGNLPLFTTFSLSSLVLDGQPTYTLETFMTDFCDIVFLDQSNVFYHTFDYFFGENSTFGLNILTSGSLLYIAYVCTVYLAWLVFDFILFIPKLCRKWLCKLTQSE